MIKPLGDRVLVRVAKQEEKTSGIIVTSEEQKAHVTGEAIAVGPEAKEVKKGDTVLFPFHELNQIEVDGETMHLIGEEFVLAKQ